MLFRVVLLGLLGACTGQVVSPEIADSTTGSTTILSLGRELVNVNEEERSVTLLDPATGGRSELALPGRPARIAKVGDELWVTLRGETPTIAILTARDGALQLVTQIDVPAGPFGIAASAYGSRVYVACSQAGQVLELDARSHEVLRSFIVDDEPRWITVHPAGQSMFVGSLMGGTVTHINLRSGQTRPLDIPPTTRFTREGDVTLVPRVTGDPALSPQGWELAVPMLMVDIETPVTTEPGASGEKEGEGGYGGSGTGVTRLNPTVMVVGLNENGEPTGATSLRFLASMFFPTRGEDFVEFGVIRSYPSSATYTDGAIVLTAEGSEALYVMSRTPFVNGSPGIDFGGTHDPNAEPFTPPEVAGFDLWPVAVVETQDGPRGVAVQNEQLFVHQFIEHSVSRVSMHDVTDAVDVVREIGFAELTVGAGIGLQVAESELTPEQEQGRALFYSARDARMAGTGAGVSCATCHFDGRNDGLTWTLQGEPRQTPSLAGPVSQTAPVTWSNDVPSVAAEAQETSQLRMGGEGLTETEALAIQAYVDSVPYPGPRRDRDDVQVVRGEQVFIDSGCANCHFGDLYTDNNSHEILPGRMMQTPTLRGIAASAPYLHDGSLPTLAAVVQFARSGAMGDTSALSDDDAAALVGYLESL